MLKKLISIILTLTIGVLPLSSYAAGLDDAFNSLMGGASGTVNAPGAFSSQARSGISAGGFDLRVPRAGNSAPQLLNITLPKISAGCNGISAHFGGFSFISGAEFGDLLKKIASGAALGFVTALTMKTLCPACEAVVQELKSAAAAAAKLAKDSCAIGQNAAKAFMDGTSDSPDLPNKCSQIVAMQNGDSDSLSAWKNTCKGIMGATAKLNDLYAGVYGDPSTPAGKTANAKVDEAQACNDGAGNITWARLSVYDKVDADAPQLEQTESARRKLLIMNMTGAQLGPKEGVGCDDYQYTPGGTQAGSTTDLQPGSHYCPPPIDSRILAGIFMCGAPDIDGKLATTNATERVVSYCADYFAENKDLQGIAASSRMWDCGDSDYGSCKYLYKTSANNVIKGEGFLVRVNRLLNEAVSRVKTGAGFTDSKGIEIIKLVNIAPYPLYQAINAAAVYPSAGSDLIDSMSILVAEQFAYLQLDDLLKVTNRGSTAKCSISQQQASKMLDFMGSLRAEASARHQLIGQNFTLTQGIARQIHDINAAIQQQTMSEDMLGATRMAQSINNVVRPVKE